MESRNVKKAKEIIRKYPEVFESLLEFERTKKLPEALPKEKDKYNPR